MKLTDPQIFCRRVHSLVTSLFDGDVQVDFSPSDNSFSVKAQYLFLGKVIFKFSKQYQELPNEGDIVNDMREEMNK